MAAEMSKQLDYFEQLLTNKIYKLTKDQELRIIDKFKDDINKIKKDYLNQDKFSG